MMTRSSAWLITPGELLGEEPEVQRVEHRAHAGNREVRLEVLLGVPEEGADPVAGLDPEPGQRRGEPIDPLGHVGERGAPAPVRRRRHHLASPVDLTAVLEEMRDGERKVLHRAQHLTTPHAVPGGPPRHRPAEPASHACAQGRNRTDGLPLRRRLLYPLSYLGGGMSQTRSQTPVTPTRRFETVAVAAFDADQAFGAAFRRSDQGNRGLLGRGVFACRSIARGAHSITTLRQQH